MSENNRATYLQTLDIISFEHSFPSRLFVNAASQISRKRSPFLEEIIMLNLSKKDERIQETSNNIILAKTMINIFLFINLNPKNQ